jgi:CheY-like chemotaxis protein
MPDKYTEGQWVSRFALELKALHPLDVQTSMDVALREYMRHPQADPVVAAQLFAQSSPKPYPMRIRVLVVDDAEAVAYALVLLLDAEGIEARAAYGGQQALTLLPSYRPDVVLLDLQMPDVSGREVAEAIMMLPKAFRPAVVVHTSLDLDHVVLSGLTCDRLIKKSAEIDQLAEVLSKVAGEVHARRTEAS